VNDRLDPKTLEVLAALEKELQTRQDENRLVAYKPYPKQRDFHGTLTRERLLMAGNQLGKTVAGAAEMAMHLTGMYPDWWNGRRFDKPIVAWAGSVTGLATRDTVQRMLMGRPGQQGHGSIPKKSIIEAKSAIGVPDLLDHVKVRHAKGGVSMLAFKSYEQGREKWQGESLDIVWFDEEPAQDIYTEGLTRTNATRGMVYMTFTPLLGMSDVVKRFLIDRPVGTAVIGMTIADAEHYTKEQRDEIVASYPPHEREARANGIPMLGSGRVFPVEEGLIAVQAFQVPGYWPRICGIDFGWDHPTAAAWLTWDRDNDVVYVVDCYRRSEANVAQHAAVLRAKGCDWMPVAWPHDGLNDTAVGPQLAKQYREQGIAMRPENAKFPLTEDGRESGRTSVEAGISAMLERMESGRLKVFNHLNDWFEEFRLYHRKSGKLVKERDDVLSATRYALMDLRFSSIKKRSVEPTTAEWKPFDPAMGY
jgi:phage terminase large subunit-like protein